MAFVPQSLKPLTDAEVQPFDGVNGVYGMTDANAVVLYVGMGDIGAELRRYAPPGGDNQEINRRRPTHFLAETMHRAGIIATHAREIQLIREFNPACNTQHTM